MIYIYINNISLLLLLSPIFIFSQISINTIKEDGVLHVHGNSNETILKVTSNNKDNFVINSDGNIGVNESNPTNKLVISNDVLDNNSTGLQLTNGSIAGLKLTSDKKGNAYWNNNIYVNASFPTKSMSEDTKIQLNVPYREGVVIEHISNNGSAAATREFNYDTGAKISIPKGKWTIHLNLDLDLFRPEIGDDYSTTYIKADNVIQENVSLWCSLYLSKSGTRNILDDNNSTNIYRIQNMNRSIGHSIGQGMNLTNINGDLLINIPKKNLTLNLIMSCKRNGLSSTTTDIGFKPRIVFDKAGNNSFFATPL